MIALYDEQEVMERYVESKENEASIRTFIETCQDFGATVTETIQKLVSKYALSNTAAESKVQRYWK